MNRTSIFIKTCKKDLSWLNYCLRSIKSHASSLHEVVIVLDEDCRNEEIFKASESQFCYFVSSWENGYIQQQHIKLHADKYCTGNLILFVDSDCVFMRAFSPESFLKDKKPILLKTRYGNLEGAEAWKAITESFVGFPVEFEYMRRMPLIYKSSSISEFRNAHSGNISHLQSMTDRAFSEFNAIGAWIDRTTPDQYFISDTECWMPPVVAKQFWSWGGISEEIAAEMESYIQGVM